MGTGRHVTSAAGSMARSQPVTVFIPAIHVSARVIPVGLTPGGGVAVPPLSHPFLAGWYDAGPAPGQAGPAVIVGHVDAASVGPAVFYDLGRLRPGQRIDVTLADGRTAIFVVSAAALYPKASFPASAVYGPTRLPTLRLITCGGSFDSRTGHYLGSVVVYADFAGQRAAASADPSPGLLLTHRLRLSWLPRSARRVLA
jgi:Sortase domain